MDVNMCRCDTFDPRGLKVSNMIQDPDWFPDWKTTSMHCWDQICEASARQRNQRLPDPPQTFLFPRPSRSAAEGSSDKRWLESPELRPEHRKVQTPDARLSPGWNTCRGGRSQVAGPASCIKQRRKSIRGLIKIPNRHFIKTSRKKVGTLIYRIIPYWPDYKTISYKIYLSYIYHYYHILLENWFQLHDLHPTVHSNGQQHLKNPE